MAQAIVQTSALVSWGYSTNTGYIYLTSVAAGNDIVVQLYSQQFSATPGYSVNDGVAYTQEGFQTFNGVYNVAQYRLRNVSAGTHTIAVVCSSIDLNTVAYGIASEVSGDADAAVDKTAINSGSSTTPTTGSSGVLSQANEIVFVAFGSDGANTGETYPPTAGYTGLADDATNSYQFSYKVVAATTAVSAAQGTLNTSRAWGAVLNTFKGIGTSVPSTLILLAGA